MKLAIFGSTGGIGQHLVPQALDAGHTVTAFTRSPGKLNGTAESVTVVEGDVQDLEAVRRAVAGQDAVICALGMPLFNSEGLRAAGTANIVRAMEEAGVRRLVCLSAYGTRESWDILPAHYRYLIAPIAFRRLFADHGNQEDLVKGSSLDWTIARPGNFTDGPRTGTYRHGFAAWDPSLKLKVSRADVAEFLLKQVANDDYLLQAPCLSY